MIRNVIPGKLEEVKPDILIPYNINRETLSNSAMLTIYVRPETNKTDYEAVIIKSTSPYADVVYLASLSGTLVNDKALVASHYSSQLQFAIEGKKRLAQYPEMIEWFEKKFKVKFQDAKIVGPFEAILEYKLKKDADELFETMVPEPHFLEMFGQTIKKIGEYYVLNYDIPFVITRHHEETAMFVIALRLKSNRYRFSDIDHLIYDNMCKSETTWILDSEKRKNLAWYRQVRRTYHISRGHIEAMFDLTDFVFKNEKEQIRFTDTPLGRKLLEQEILGEEQLEERLAQLKEHPLVYLNQTGGNGKNSLKLVNIILEGRVKKGATFIENDLDECTRIIKKINWEKFDFV
jgi:hypothetical protein